MKAGETMRSEFGMLTTKEEYMMHELLLEQRKTNELLRELIEQSKPAPVQEKTTVENPKTLGAKTTAKAGVK